MKLKRIVTAAAVACAALAVSGATAASAETVSDDVSVMAWRIVDGPWPNTHEGKNQCVIEDGIYEFLHKVPAGCLLDADGNQWFLWANL